MKQEKRGIMARLGSLFGRSPTPPPTIPILPMHVLPPSMRDVGPVTTKEEYEREVKRIAERNARLRRMGWDLDVVTRGRTGE